MYQQHLPAAPWSLFVRIVTPFTLLLMAAILAIGLAKGPAEFWRWQFPMVGLPLTFLVASPFFVIRGYVLEEGGLRVQRLGWHSRVDLRHVRGVRHDPAAMKWAFKLFGNGGLFCFAGLFRSKALGNFRAFVTDPKNAVVIETDGRTYVVSPRDPEGLVKALEGRLAM